MHSQDWNWTSLPDSLPKANSPTSNGPHLPSRPGTSKPRETEETLQTSVSQVLWWSFLIQKEVYFWEWWANMILNVNQMSKPISLTRGKNPSVFLRCVKLCAYYTSIEFVRVLLPEWMTLTWRSGALSALKTLLEIRLSPVGGRMRVMELLTGMLFTDRPADANCWKSSWLL